MTQQALKRKWEEALNAIIDESIDRDSLESPIRSQVADGVQKDAIHKSTKIHEYLVEFVFSRIDELEGRVAELEDRIKTLGSAGPTGGVTGTT